MYLVGGAVRDAYLRRSVTDVDIAIGADATAAARRVADRLGADVYVMDRERDVARVLFKWRGARYHVDFARLRGATLAEDLRDRDFTMNAMAADLRGSIDRLIDPLKGATDLQRRVLRRCSADAIKNDPIRALRAVRLSAQFQLKIHPGTSADIREYADGLRQSSGERIRDEFFKLLALDQAARGLRVLRHVGLLRQVLPGLAEAPDGARQAERATDAWTARLATVERLVQIQTAISSRRTDNTAAAFDLGMLVIQLDRFRGALRRHLGRVYGGARSHGQLLTLAALLLEGGADDAATLKLSAEEERQLQRAISNVHRIPAGPRGNKLELHRFWFSLKEGGIDVILMSLARYLAATGSALKQQDWLGRVEAATNLLDVYFNQYDAIVDPPLLLDGNDVLTFLQLKPGPLIGKLLRGLREAQVTGEVRSAGEALDFIGRQFKCLNDADSC